MRVKPTLRSRILKKALKAKEITLIGGNAEEAPMAYKNIETVMASQRDLVDIIGSFQPKIVRSGQVKR